MGRLMRVAEQHGCVHVCVVEREGIPHVRVASPATLRDDHGIHECTSIDYVKTYDELLVVLGY